jgi:hypothetical protein
MKSIFGLRGRRLAITTVAIFAVAGGVAYAAIPDAAGVYHGCVLKNGTLRIIDPDTDQCKANERAITFNQTGQKGDPGSPGAPGQPGADGTNGTNGTDGTNGTNGAPGQPGADGKDGTNGTDGTSPTVAQLGPGNPNCLNGGVAITDAAGTTAYVCSGQNGQNGTDGQPFSGTFTSPNGQYSISVTDTGVTIAHGGSTISLVGTDIRVHSSGTAELESALGMTLRGSTDVTVESASGLALKGGTDVNVVSGGTATVQGSSIVTIKGSTVKINPGAATCLLAARMGDPVLSSSTNQGATSTGTIMSGSGTVCIGG